MCFSLSKSSIFTPKYHFLTLQSERKEEGIKILSFSFDNTPSILRR
jgi:hypothetical protein